MARQKPKPKQAKQKQILHNGAKNKAEMEERHEFVESLIGSGLRYRQTIRAIMEKYNVCRTTGERYIKAVYKKWEAEESEKRPERKREAKERVREVFMRALNDKQYGPAVRAVELLCKMEGVDPGEIVKLEHSGEVREIHEVGESTLDFLRMVVNDKKLSDKFFSNWKAKDKGKHASDSDKK